MSDTNYDPSGNSNDSFHIGVDILNLLFLYHIFFISFHVYLMLKFDKATYLSLLFKFILSERLSNK